MNVTEENYKTILQSAIASKHQKYASHFEADDLKRVLMVFPKDGWKEFEKKVNEEIEGIAEMIMNAYQERLSKVVFLKDYPEFEKKYPFLVVN